MIVEHLLSLNERIDDVIEIGKEEHNSNRIEVDHKKDHENSVSKIVVDNEQIDKIVDPIKIKVDKGIHDNDMVVDAEPKAVEISD